MLEKINTHFGIDLPLDFCDAYQSGIASDSFHLCSVDEIFKLDLVNPLSPLRFLPFMTDLKGDVYGLYFPRNPQITFIASIGISDGYILPLTQNCSHLFGDPEIYEEEGYIDVTLNPNSTVLRSAKIENNCSTLSEAILKPFVLNQFELDQNAESLAKDILSKPNDFAFDTPFKEPIEIFTLGNWFDLSDNLLLDDKPQEAFYALENAHSLLCIPPHRGFPESNNVDVYYEASRLFSKMYQIDSSCFDNELNAALIRFQHSIAQDWSSWSEK